MGRSVAIENVLFNHMRDNTTHFIDRGVQAHALCQRTPSAVRTPRTRNRLLG